MKTIVVSAPGKLHLLGEHTVVYGKPALLAAVSRRCFVTVTTTISKDITILFEQSEKNREMFKQDNLKLVLSPNAILDKTKEARRVLQEFSQTQDTKILKELFTDPLNYVVICIGETLLNYQKEISSGFTLTITSDILFGSGMGSSASCAAAVTGAVSLFLDKPLDKKIINDIAYQCEKYIHGNPSGADNATVIYGGFVWYRKETPEIKLIQPLPVIFPKKISENFIVIFTGKPLETTGEMVALVRRQRAKSKGRIDKIFSDQELLVKELAIAIKEEEGKKIKEIIKKGEKNLEKIGVVSSSTKKIVRQIEKIGGAAKICGAGGRKKASGVVLAFHENRKVLEDLLQFQKLDYSTLKLGEEGIKEEIYVTTEV